MRTTTSALACFVFPLSLVGPFIGQAPTTTGAPLSPDQIIEKVHPSVALVLAGKFPTMTDAMASAIVIRESGVLLTAYHVVKDAGAVQIRFKNGDIFDDVQLLGVDRRRDVAAIRIAASGLPVLQTASARQAKAGDPVCVVSHAAALPWSASVGIVSAYRLADGVPGAGTGYRVLQFTTSASEDSSGGVVVDSRGHVLGLIVGLLQGGPSSSFAVPIENVLGLADAAPAQTFASGSELSLPRAAAGTTTPAAAEPTAVPPTASVEPERSDALQISNNPEFILRTFRTMRVDASRAPFFGSDHMTAALRKAEGFDALKITIVDDPRFADVVLEVGYTFPRVYPFSLKHQNTSIVLLSGRGSGSFLRGRGAGGVAKEFVKLLKAYRGAAPQSKTEKE